MRFVMTYVISAKLYLATYCLAAIGQNLIVDIAPPEIRIELTGRRGHIFQQPALQHPLDNRQHP